MKAGTLLASYLREVGVRRVFGVPGSQTIEMIECIRGAGLDFVLTHHEATAAFCAAMTGHLSGVPGVCIGAGGPGAVNLLAGIATAHLDRMPLICLLGDHQSQPASPAHQRLPAGYMSGVTRDAWAVDAGQLADRLPALVDRALQNPPGPVLISLTSNETIKEAGSRLPAAGLDRAPGEAAQPDVSHVIELIGQSQRAMIIGGLGVATSRCEAALLRFAEQLACPVADTPEMKGFFPNRHPQYVGTFATHRNHDVKALAAESDLIITVGLDSVEFLAPWDLATPCVQLVQSGALPDPAIPGEVVAWGSLSQLLDVLAASAKPRGSWSPDHVTQVRGRILTTLDPGSPDPPGRMWPQTVVSELGQVAGEATVTVDAGSHKLLMVQQWLADRPMSFLNSSGMSSMGTGMPFALAAKLHDPSRPVAAVIGDGGLLMYGGELATLARSGMPIVVIVMTDSALYSIKVKQERKGYPTTGTDLSHSPVPIAQVARDHGLNGHRVTTRMELRAALVDAFAGSRPTVIEAIIDPTGYALSQ